MRKNIDLSMYPKKITVGNRWIGKNEPTFIIAEAACNHMCDIELAKTMIESLKAKIETKKKEEESKPSQQEIDKLPF